MGDDLTVNGVAFVRRAACQMRNMAITTSKPVEKGLRRVDVGRAQVQTALMVLAGRLTRIFAEFVQVFVCARAAKLPAAK